MEAVEFWTTLKFLLPIKIFDEEFTALLEPLAKPRLDVEPEPKTKPAEPPDAPVTVPVNRPEPEAPEAEPDGKKP